MIAVLCVDDNRGMLFNSRRQSRDRVVLDRVLALAAEAGLWMNQYSAKLFSEKSGAQIIVDDLFLEKAQEGQYCFVENVDLEPYEAAIEKIILYRWNRVYPADTYFAMPLQENGWRQAESRDFPGYSHDKITEEVYVR